MMPAEQRTALAAAALVQMLRDKSNEQEIKVGGGCSCHSGVLVVGGVGSGGLGHLPGHSAHCSLMHITYPCTHACSFGCLPLALQMDKEVNSLKAAMETAKNDTVGWGLGVGQRGHAPMPGLM